MAAGRFVQFVNASNPMLVTLAGIVTLVRLLQFMAKAPMPVTGHPPKVLVIVSAPV